MNRPHPPAAGSPISAVALLLAAAAAPAAYAQVGPLGPRRAQLFDREVLSEKLTVADPPDTALPDSFRLRRLLPAGPPVLLGGELDRKGQHVVVVPPNLRDFALVLAADPAHRGGDQPRWSGTIAVDRRLDGDGGLTGKLSQLVLGW